MNNGFGEQLCNIGPNITLFNSNSKILEELVSTWEHNRPSDPIRVQAVKEYIQEKGYVDGIIFVVEYKDENKRIVYACIDGNHRREALTLIDEKIDVLVAVMWNASNEEIKEKFIALNQSVPVPELYTSFTSSEASKMVVTGIVDHFRTKWPTHVSSAKKPHKPHFNRDAIIDKIASKNFSSVSEGIKYYDELNEKCKQVFGRRDANKKYIKKCEFTGCYLFIDINVLN